MSSTWSLSFRLNFQAPGDNLNTWGLVLNQQVFQLLEDERCARTGLTLNGNTYTLSTANGARDEARVAWLDVAAGSTGGVIVIPSVPKQYVVTNGASGAVTITTGGSVNAVLQPGTWAQVISDGARVLTASPSDFGGRQLRNIADPTADTDAASKRWTVAQLMQIAAAGLPDYTGNANRFITSDGMSVKWGDPLPAQSASTVGMLLRSNGTPFTGGFWDFDASQKYFYFNAKVVYLTSAHRGGYLFIDTNTVTDVFLPASSALNAAFAADLWLQGPGGVTLRTQGNDVLAGPQPSAFYMPSGEARRVVLDQGVHWYTPILKPYSATIISTQAFPVGPGYSRHVGLLWGGGAGGAYQPGSVAGGGGGACIPFDIPATAFGTSQTITIGGGGAGATQQYTAGGQGGTSSIGGLVVAYGGGGGAGPSQSAGGGAFGPGSGTSGGGGGGAFAGGSVSTVALVRDASYGGAAGAGPNGNGGNPAGSSLYGGGGGGGFDGAGGGGPIGNGYSQFGGSGGAYPGNPGAAPAGGGGGAINGPGGNGGRGECRIRGIV